jgi:hypothetical protein
VADEDPEPREDTRPLALPEGHTEG